LGGFGFKGRNVFSSLPEPPKRLPDFVKKVSTYSNQAIYFGLTGDRNPLHLIPEIAQSQQFTRPILHGIIYLDI
jgi:multifunctional beta-oxidation protein